MKNDNSVFYLANCYLVQCQSSIIKQLLAQFIHEHEPHNLQTGLWNLAKFFCGKLSPIYVRRHCNSEVL